MSLKTYLVYENNGVLTLQEVQNPTGESAREIVGVEAIAKFSEWEQKSGRFQQDKITDSIKEYYLNEVFGLC